MYKANVYRLMQNKNYFVRSLVDTIGLNHKSLMIKVATYAALL